MVGRLKSELRGRAGQAVRGSKGRRGASRRRKAGGARSMARRLTGRGSPRRANPTETEPVTYRSEAPGKA